MTMPHYQVVVVGAGPTGLTLANLLGLYGVSVLLVEQNAATVSEARAVSIDDESLRTLQLAGLVEEAMRDIASSYGSDYVGPNRRSFAAVKPSRSEYGWPKRNAFRQPLLEATLARGLQRHASVTTRFETLCVEHREDGGQVIVTLQDAQGTADVACDYLVAADGGKSRTRKAIGATLEGTSFKEENWLIVDLHATKDPFRETRVVCDAARPVLSVPGPHLTRRYEMRLKPGETVAEMEDEARVRRLLAEYGPDAEAPIDRICVYTFHARIADRWRNGRVFLAGDAAHLTPPFAGQGMNTGLRDAANLAWKLAAVLQGRLGPGLLDSYQPERRPHAKSMIQLAITMGRVMAPHSAMVAALTRGAFTLARAVPGARAWLAQMRFKPKPRLASGFFVADGPLGRRLAGTMFPQPLVEVVPADPVSAPAPTSVPLDEVLGPGFACLCFGPDPAALATRLGDLPAAFDARLVGCLPRTLGFASTPLPVMLRDATEVIETLLGGAREVMVVLRPDRYVAGVIEAGTESATIAGLMALRAASWPSRRG
jgi:3-(3-hydroxy-phenyl)propionate hydroxylase